MVENFEHEDHEESKENAQELPQNAERRRLVQQNLEHAQRVIACQPTDNRLIRSTVLGFGSGVASGSLGGPTSVLVGGIVGAATAAIGTILDQQDEIDACVERLRAEAVQNARHTTEDESRRNSEPAFDPNQPQPQVAPLLFAHAAATAPSAMPPPNPAPRRQNPMPRQFNALVGHRNGGVTNANMSFSFHF